VVCPAIAGYPRGVASRRPRPAARSELADAPAIDFRALADAMPDVVYVLDLEGRFVWLNPRAYEVFGYTPAEGAQFIGRSFTALLAPGAAPAAVGAIRHRAEFPLDRQLFEVDLLHRDGTPIRLEVHASPVWQDGRMVGRMGVCRVLAAVDRDGAVPRTTSALALQEERMRIARGLRDAVAQVVFGVTPDRDASESFLADVKRATRTDLARRLRLDAVDLEILQRIAEGASNREIGQRVHLSPAAIKDRVRRLMDRLGARRRAELAAHALRLGIA
jgi:PAS domain S-box-containing protein